MMTMQSDGGVSGDEETIDCNSYYAYSVTQMRYKLRVLKRG